jgi:hypothetical protein
MTRSWVDLPYIIHQTARDLQTGISRQLHAAATGHDRRRLFIQWYTENKSQNIIQNEIC